MNEDGLTLDDTTSIINQNNDIYGIRVYPNPTTDHVKVTTSEDLNLLLKISDLSGNIVYTAKIKNQETSIDVSNLQTNTGVLIFSFFDNSGLIHTDKILVK